MVKRIESTRRGSTTFHGVVLSHGANEVDDDIWEAMKRHRVIQARLADQTLRECEPPPPAPSPAPAPSILPSYVEREPKQDFRSLPPPSPFPPAHDDDLVTDIDELLALKEPEAREMALRLDEETLVVWAELEPRTRVAAFINKHLERLEG